MSLSICLLTNEPAPRVANLLAPVRPLADEIVIAADDRVERGTLAGYAALADRLFAIEYQHSEAHLAWLHAQCKCDWILRLDGDEVLSASLVRSLPRLLSLPEVQQYWIRRDWLFGDRETRLDELPWSTDHNNRLVRNDGTLRFPGLQHTSAEPAGTSAYIEEPIYHLELLLEPEEARRAKAVRYEVTRPHLLTPPGGARLNEAFYLPELRPTLRTRRVPSEDLPALERAVDLSCEVEGGAIDHIRHLSLAEMAAATEPDPGKRSRGGFRSSPRARRKPTLRLRRGEVGEAKAGRHQIDAAACRARIRCLEDDVVFAPGEGREVFFEVANTGSVRWPGGIETEPLIRLSYRWLLPDGSVKAPEGPRSPFPAAVAPGVCAVVPLGVAAPDEAGSYLLEVDVVHEHVRWFGAAQRTPVSVNRRPVLPPAGPRLRETSRPHMRRLRRLRIPRVIHRVWLGGAQMPDRFEVTGATFADHHPAWEMRLWGDTDLPSLGVTDEDRARARTRSELSNPVRYRILRQEGGVYVDADLECRGDLSSFLRGLKACAALDGPGRLGTGFLAAAPRHRVFERAATEARKTLGLGADAADANGPYFLSLLVEQEGGVAIFPRHPPLLPLR